MEKLKTCLSNGRPTKDYRRWSSMCRRCYDKEHLSYPTHGARGVTVCARWLDLESGFTNFVLDMDACPRGKVLGRKDANGPYSPENCYWATMKEKARSRRKRGPTIGSLRSRALIAGLPYMVVYLRVNRLGWTIKRALETPVQQRGGWRGAIKGGKVMAAIALGAAPNYTGSESDVKALLKRLAKGESVESINASTMAISPITGLPEMPSPLVEPSTCDTHDS